MQPSDIEHLARAEVPGSGPIVLERLSLGLVNESYRVARSGRQYTLRIPAADPAALGLDRFWECRVLAAAAAAGLAPAVERCDPAREILVTGWVAGEPWPSLDTPTSAGIARIADLARRIHALPLPDNPRVMKPAAWIDHYETALRQRGALPRQSLRALVQVRLEELARLPDGSPTLCHSDLHPQNLMVTARGLTLLDWEYAHVAEPLWDLAGWVSNNDLHEAAGQALLGSYCGAEAKVQQPRWRLLCWLYDYVCLLWSELYLQLRTSSAAAIAARALVLAGRLERGF